MSDAYSQRYRRPQPRRRRRNPVFTLLVIAAIPALALFGLFRWSSGVALADRSAAPPDDPYVLEGQAPPPALNTGLLSLRRTAPVLSVSLNVDDFRKAIAPLAESINDTSCLDIRINGRQAVEVNPDVATIPASNQKLLVAVVATELLGEDFRYETRVVGGNPVDGVIDGDIYLVGGGDPVLAGEWYESVDLDGHREFNTTSLDSLAQRLADNGVERISGDVVGDGSRYDDEYYAPGWADGVAIEEAGPYDALMANDARVKGNDEKVSDPVEGAAAEFIRLLDEIGVTVDGSASSGEAPADAATLAVVESAPLPKILEEMLTNSDNNTAEMVVKEIGFAATGSGTRQAGVEAMESVIEGWGIDVSGMVLDDGSGLSPADRVTCRQLVGLLEHATVDSPMGRGLAIAGETGTLQSFFGDTTLSGRLVGKTGTLYNPPVSEDPPATKALSGFLPAGDDMITYAMVLNGPSIAERGEYVPIWDEFAAAMATYPAVATAESLGPR